MGAQAAISGIGLGTSLLGKAFGGSSYASGTGRGADATEAFNSARATTAAGGTALSAGLPLIQQAGSYYQKLLGGNAAAVQEAVAPQRQALQSTYEGAEKGLAAGPLRGGARDYATAELARQKAGQIGGLGPAAIQAAAPQAASLGLGATQAGTSASAAGGSLYNQLLGLSQQQNVFDVNQRTELGTGVSGFLNNLLKTYYQPKGEPNTPGRSSPAVGAGSQYVGSQLIGGTPANGSSFFNPNAAFGGIRF